MKKFTVTMMDRNRCLINRSRISNKLTGFETNDIGTKLIHVQMYVEPDRTRLEI